VALFVIAIDVLWSVLMVSVPFESEVVVHHLEPWLVYVIFKVTVDGMELLPGDGAIITSWEGP